MTINKESSKARTPYSAVKPPPLWRGFVVAVAAIGAALLVRFALDPWLGNHLPYPTFFVAVAGVVWYARSLAASLVAIFLGALVALWFFIPPRFSFDLSGAQQQVGFAAYFMVTLAFIGFGHALERARRRAEDIAQERDEQRERLRVTLGSIGDAVMVANTECRVIYMNQVAQELTGWMQADAAGLLLKKVFQIVNEQTHKPVENPCVRSLREGTIVGLANHTLLISRDGTERPIDDSASPIRDAQGNITGVVLIFRDVTERRRNEQAIAERDARKSAILEAALDCIITADHEDRIVDFNPAAEKTFGFRAEEVKGKLLADTIIPPRLREAHQRGMQRFLQTGEQRVLGKRIEMPALRADGTEILVELAISVVRLENRPPFFTAYLRDITERKQAEEALRRSETASAHLAAIVSSSDDAIVSKDLNGVIRSWNEGAQRLFGYTGQEAIGQPVTMLIPAERLHEETAILERLRRGERLDHFDTVRLRKDGSPLEVSLTISPIKDATGQVIGASKIARDITEQKHSEEALRRREELLRSVTEHAKVGLVIVSPEHRYLYANRAYATILGLPSHEIIAHRVADVLKDAYDSQIRPRLERAFRGEQVQYELTLPPLHGHKHQRFFEITYEPQLEDAQLRSVIVVVIDLTERKQAEEALRESEERYRTLFANAPIAVFACDRNAVIQHYNQRAVELWGREPQCGVEQHCGSVKLWLPDGALLPHAQSPMMEVLRTGVPARNVEVFIERPDGSRLSVLVNFAALKNARGEITGAITSFVDISERKRAEEALRESAERLRFMAESMPQKIFTAKPNGNVDYFNQQWAEFTGLSFQQIRDWGWLQFIHPDDVEENIRRWKHSIETGEYFQLEHRFRRHDGVYRWHLSRAHAMRDAQGKVLMWIGSNTDIDDQKQAEEKLEKTVAERTAKLQETIGDLEAFSYSVAHDLRAPLRAMSGYAQAVMGDSSLSAESRNYLERISRAAERLDRLTREVLSYSQLTRAETRLEPVDLDKLVHDIVEQTPELAARCAHIQIRSPLLPVIGHEPLLTQALSNLLNNACKFMAPGAMPRIRLWTEGLENFTEGPEISTEGNKGNEEPKENVSPSFSSLPSVKSSQASSVKIVVEDNGIGIDPRHKERLFKLFGRIHPEHKYEGTGVGLAIVKKAAERMGGTVGVESEPGKGSRFWIQLRAAD